MRRRALLAAFAALGLAGCAGGSGTAVRQPPPRAAPPPAIAAQPAGRAGRAVPGQIIGASEAELLALLGTPRLLLTEGDARKLQFANPECVLDIYLYPASTGAPPQATYAEARTRADGGALPEETCLAAIMQGRRVPR